MIETNRKCAYLCGPHLLPCNRPRAHQGFCYHWDDEKDSEIPCIAAVAREQAEHEDRHRLNTEASDGTLGESADAVTERNEAERKL